MFYLIIYFIIAFIFFIVGNIILYSYIFIEYGGDDTETDIFVLLVIIIFLMSLVWFIILPILIITLIIDIIIKLSENKLKTSIIKIYGKFIIEADSFIIEKGESSYLYSFYKNGKAIKRKHFNGYYKLPIEKMINLK